MRYYVARKGVYDFTYRVDRYLEHELAYHDIERLEGFAKEVEIFGHEFYMKLFDMKFWAGNSFHRKTIVGVSAPAKGNTLLNYCNIDTTILDYITEKSELKIGKFTPGTHIPIVPDSRLIEDQPDYAVILAHNWSGQIKNSLKDFRGRWIIPNGKRQQGVRSGAFGACGECDCTGTKTERVHECSGVSCGSDGQIPDVHGIPQGIA
jgi:hypothetical protein